MKRHERSRWPTFFLLLATTACGASHFGLASASPEAQSWAAPLVGSWAVVEAATGRELAVTTTPRDTAVWQLGAGGRLRHGVAVVRSASTKERTTELAWWWVESQSVGGARIPVLCTSARPSRNRQCARIRLDTLTGPDGRPTKRFVWSGVTFKSQHWTFVERTETGGGAHKR